MPNSWRVGRYRQGLLDGICHVIKLLLMAQCGEEEELNPGPSKISVYIRTCANNCTVIFIVSLYVEKIWQTLVLQPYA